MTQYTLEDAIRLARSLKYGPLPNPSDPDPSPEEALEMISKEQRECGFNWLTGAEAHRVLEDHIKEKQQ